MLLPKVDAWLNRFVPKLSGKVLAALLVATMAWLFSLILPRFGTAYDGPLFVYGVYIFSGALAFIYLRRSGLWPWYFLLGVFLLTNTLLTFPAVYASAIIVSILMTLLVLKSNVEAVPYRLQFSDTKLELRFNFLLIATCQLILMLIGRLYILNDYRPPDILVGFANLAVAVALFHVVLHRSIWWAILLGCWSFCSELMLLYVFLRIPHIDLFNALLLVGFFLVINYHLAMLLSRDWPDRPSRLHRRDLWLGLTSIMGLGQCILIIIYSWLIIGQGFIATTYAWLPLLGWLIAITKRSQLVKS